MYQEERTHDRENAPTGPRVGWHHHDHANADGPDHGQHVDRIARAAEMPRPTFLQPTRLRSPAQIDRRDVGKVEADDADGRDYGIGSAVDHGEKRQCCREPNCWHWRLQPGIDSTPDG